MSDQTFETPGNSPVLPAQLDVTQEIQFSCHKGISCFNECCKQSDITLAPYDIIRMKNHLGISSGEFLKKYTVPFEMDQHKVPGVKMKTVEGSQVCQFLGSQEEGCTIYENRPTACRYYPLGLLTMKKANEKSDQTNYCLIEEDHCMGHKENNRLTISQYRKEQQVLDYDEYNKEYYQLIVKKRTAGPAIGGLPEMSLQLFFMVCFDIDRFRKFFTSDSFQNTYVITEKQKEILMQDDNALLKFGYQLLRQVLFDEMSIDMVANAYEKRAEERKEVIELRKKAEIEKWKKDQEQLQREVTDDDH